jgi:hypothetical protein
MATLASPECRRGVECKRKRNEEKEIGKTAAELNA